MTNIVFFGVTPHSKIISDALRAAGKFDVKLTLSPSDIDNPELINKIKLVRPVVGVVADFGRLIPGGIIDLFPKGIINLHPSLLPKHRGAIPAVTTILDGDKISGISVIIINDKFDSGAILAQAETPVLVTDIPATLYDRLFTLGARVLIKTIPEYLEGRLTPTPQKAGDYPYEKRLTKESGRIDWKKSDEYLERFIRAMQPWPGAWTTIEDLCNLYVGAVRALPASLPDGNRPVGNRLTGFARKTPTIKVNRAKLNPAGKLEILELQIEGKKPITWQQFSSGYLNPNS